MGLPDFFVLLECVNKRFLSKLFFFGNLFFRTLDGLVGVFSSSAAEHSSSGFVRKRKNAHGGMTFIPHDESQNLSFKKKKEGRRRFVLVETLAFGKILRAVAAIALDVALPNSNALNPSTTAGSIGRRAPSFSSGRRSSVRRGPGPWAVPRSRRASFRGLRPCRRGCA